MYARDSSSIRPENALKRAEELVNVGQPLAALTVLFEVITSRKFKQWQKALEDIMLKVRHPSPILPIHFPFLFGCFAFFGLAIHWIIYIIA